MSLNIQSLASLQNCVRNNTARAFFVPDSGSTIYEALPGYSFVVGMCYGGTVVDRIEHTVSGMLWGINDKANDHCIVEDEADEWYVNFAEQHGFDWVRVETELD